MLVYRYTVLYNYIHREIQKGDKIMARAKKIKATEEVKHEEVEGQTVLPFVDAVPEQTEEVLTAKDFPHQPKGKGGRPLNPNKKIQMKLYMTADNKDECEYLARKYGLTSSKLVGLLIEKIHSMDLAQELTEFLGVEPVSEEEIHRLIKVQSDRSVHGRYIKHYDFNLLRKIQFSQGQFCPAEMLESFALFSFLNWTAKKTVSLNEFSNLISEKFREDEIKKIRNYIERFVQLFCEKNVKNRLEVMSNLWKIENFFCENIYDLKFNPKAKKIVVSEQNFLYKLLLGE